MPLQAVGQIECPFCQEEVFVVKDESKPGSKPFISNHERKGISCAGFQVEPKEDEIKPVDPALLAEASKVAYLL